MVEVMAIIVWCQVEFEMSLLECKATGVFVDTHRVNCGDILLAIAMVVHYSYVRNA